MLRLICLITIGILFWGCKKESSPQEAPPLIVTEFINGMDISSLPELELTTPVFYDFEGNEKGFLDILDEAGVNYIRLRLWVDPVSAHSSLQEVKGFSDQLRQRGFKIWLTVHYSDTWADPGHQKIPDSWKNQSFSELITSVQEYTKQVVLEIKPEIIQIGNEINNGFLHPKGHLHDQPEQFFKLMEAAISEVREHSPESKIMLHYAGINTAPSFFLKMDSLDYDQIGLSYYPHWHGKDLNEINNNLEVLSNTFTQDLVIAETAYPFTLGWNDWTQNIIGANDQIIAPQFPASPKGQADFLKTIKTMVKDLPTGLGLCYWGTELIAWKGPQAQDGSPWENQALFDFNNRGLPALDVFAEEE
jgi:arabinogalactan endo-1,4-beta-galactosidase